MVDDAAQERAQQDADRAAQDAERVGFDAERVEHDEARVQFDAERVAQDVERAGFAEERVRQDVERAQQDVERGQHDEERVQYDAAVSVGLQALVNQTERLIPVVEDLNRRVNTTEEMQADIADVAGLASGDRRSDKQRRTIVLLAISVILDLVLSVAIAFGFFRIDRNADTIREIQTRTSDEVLCPLYGLFVARIADLPEDAADENEDGKVTEQEQAAFDEQIRVIEQGYAALECVAV